MPGRKVCPPRLPELHRRHRSLHILARGGAGARRPAGSPRRLPSRPEAASSCTTSSASPTCSSPLPWQGREGGQPSVRGGCCARRPCRAPAACSQPPRRGQAWPIAAAGQPHGVHNAPSARAKVCERLANRRSPVRRLGKRPGSSSSGRHGCGRSSSGSSNAHQAEAVYRRRIIMRTNAFAIRRSASVLGRLRWRGAGSAGQGSRSMSTPRLTSRLLGRRISLPPWCRCVVTEIRRGQPCEGQVWHGCVD